MDPDDARCSLLSTTFLWEAPEARSPLTRQEAIQTDIYSYGLLLTRIFLDGNCPFDRHFDIRYDFKPHHDPGEITTLKDGDGLAAHILARLESLGSYTNEQLSILESLLTATISRYAKARITCMSPIVTELERAAEVKSETLALSRISGWPKSLATRLHLGRKGVGSKQPAGRLLTRERCNNCFNEATDVAKRCTEPLRLSSNRIHRVGDKSNLNKRLPRRRIRACMATTE